jgi:Tfp pilus assembly protein PilO
MKEQEIINIIKKKSFWKKGNFTVSDYSHQSVTPLKDWCMVVYVFFVGLCAVVVYGWYMYSGSIDHSFWKKTVTQEEKQSVLQKKNLDAVEVLFAKKKISSVFLSDVSDPAL